MVTTNIKGLLYIFQTGVFELVRKLNGLTFQGVRSKRRIHANLFYFYFIEMYVTDGMRTD